MMLDYLGKGDKKYQAAHDAIMDAIDVVLREGPRTPDLGGNAKTADVGKAIAEALAGSS